MNDSFAARLPTLPEAELRQVLAHPADYRTEAVEAALAELQQRGLAPDQEALAHLRQALADRNATAQAHRARGFVARLGPILEARLRRIHQLTALLLAAGLAATALIHALTPPTPPNPLGYEATDSKKYLRDLELYGGKVNVLATEFMGWWNDRWHGRNLAVTVAVLTLVGAGGFAFGATRRARYLALDEPAERA